MKILFFYATKDYTTLRNLRKTGFEVEEADVTTIHGMGLAWKYGIMKVPTIVFLDDDKELGRAVDLPTDLLYKQIRQLA